MENATKALTMAASMLIALVIISAILLVFNNLSNYQKVNDQLKKDAKVLEFNNQFETYNRTDIRGSDLISLMNRVIDYNERQSFTGTEGKDLGYKPIILTIDVSSNIENIKVSKSADLLLFKKDASTGNYKYKIEKNTWNATLKGILDEAKNIENTYGQDNLTKLCVSIESIFLTGSPTEEQKKDAIKKYYDITKKKITWPEIENMRNDVYKYYEYLQFKRTYFDCVKGTSSGVEYDDNGRITAMYFVGNGKIE